MKLNELVKTFEIWMSNEEKALYETLDKPVPFTSFTEREQVILKTLHHKSLISKVTHDGYTFVVKNV
jgi:hypothetical protein